MRHSAAIANRITNTLLGGALALMFGCGEKSESVNAPAPAKANGSNDLNNNNGTGGTEVDPETAITDRRILDVTMHLKGSAMGIEACEGDLRVQFTFPDKNTPNAKFVSVPEDSVECILIGKIGIKELLDAPPDPTDPPAPPLDRLIVADGSVLGFRRLVGPADYEPYRPFLPAFLSATPEELQAVNVTKDVDLVMWGNRGRFPGKVTTKKVNYRRSLNQAAMGNRTFNEVYDFEFTNDFPAPAGQTINNLKFFLFERMLLRISLKPFAVLRLELDTKISDLLAGIGSAGGGAAGMGGALGSILGGVGGIGGGGVQGGALGPLLGAFTTLIKVKIEGETSDLHGALENIDQQEDPNEQFGD